MKIKIIFALLTSILILGPACDTPQERQTIEFPVSTKGESSINMENVQVMFLRPIWSEWRCFRGSLKKTVEVQLTEIIESRKYDIVKINTIYRDGRLVKAEVYYRTKK